VPEDQSKKIYDEVGYLFDFILFTPPQLEKLINGKGDSEAINEFMQDANYRAEDFIEMIQKIKDVATHEVEIQQVESELDNISFDDVEGDEKLKLVEQKKQLQARKIALKASEAKAKAFERDFPRKMVTFLRLIHATVSIPLKKFLNPIQKKTATIAIVGSSKNFIPTIKKFNEHVGLLTNAT